MQTMTAQEAWEAVERLGIDISRNSVRNEWCAVRCESSSRFQLGWGATPLEAVESLLVRIGEVAPPLPVGVQNGLAMLEELEQGREILYSASEQA